LLLFVVCVSGSSYDLSFSGNISLSGNNPDNFNFRTSLLGCFAGSYDTSGAFYNSISISGTGNSHQGDAIWGAFYIPEYEVPLAFLAYWTSQITFSHGLNFAKLNVSEAAGFVGSTFIALEEHLPNGSYVSSQYLANGYGVTWSNPPTCVSPSTQNPQISYATFVGTPASGTWSITITTVISNVVGVLSYGNTVVAPKEFVTLVQIENWPYQSTDNYLELIMGVATAEGTDTANGYFYGSGSTSVYFTLGASATSEGSNQGVRSTGFSSLDYSGYASIIRNTTLFAQASNKFQAAATVELVGVIFPSGSSDLTYAVDMGSGTPIFIGSAGRVIISFGWMLLLAMFVFLF